MDTYIKIKSSVCEKVTNLLDLKDIKYDFVDEEDILDYDEVKLDQANVDELLYELQKRSVNRPRASAGACNTGSWD